MHTLDNKIAVITGGAAGIGKALGQALGKMGCEVWVSDLRQDAAESEAVLLRQVGIVAHAIKTDVTRSEDLQSLADQVLAKSGAIDLWINNAGIAEVGSFRGQRVDVFEQMLATNLTAVINGTRIALTAMERKGTGCIVNIASLLGHMAIPYMTAYETAKHGVVGFTRGLRAELHSQRSPVRTLLVSPGFVDTQIHQARGSIHFPPWLRWMLATPDSVARDVVRAYVKGDDEVLSTWNGRCIMAAYRLFPHWTIHQSQALLAPTWQDYLQRRFKQPE